MAKNNSNGGSNGSQGSIKVSLRWKKRVKIEYDRLRQQKKFRHQDDIRVAWRKNKAEGLASKDPEQLLATGASGKPAAKPVW